MPKRKVAVPIIYIYRDRVEQARVELTVAQAVPMTKLHNREHTFRHSIESLSGMQKQVMNDLYRNLVLGNFTRLNGIGGKSAAAILNRAYPDNGALPDFELKSWAHDAGGLIVYNLLKHYKSNPAGYEVLSGILVGLLDAGILDSPQLDLRSEPDPESLSGRAQHRT